MKLGSRLRGATVGDLLIVLSVLGLVAALLRPAWEARSFGRLVEAAIADVDAVSAAARTARNSTGQWPEGAMPGTMPPGLVTLMPGDSVFARAGYTLGWSVWNVVDSVPAPPETGPAPADAPPETVAPRMLPKIERVGGVSVFSADGPLLAALSAHYAEAAPLVLDTLWLMILPERSSVAQ